MWLNLRTGFSFKSAFGHLEEVLARSKKYAGIADISTTYGHIKWKKACEKANIKPIYGIRLTVSDLHPQGTRAKRYRCNEFTLIATTQESLKNIYHLVDLAHKQFYQFPKITYDQLNNSDPDLIVLSGIAPELKKIKRKVYLQLSPNIPKNLINCGLEPVACIDNYFPCKEDQTAYESFTVDQWTMERKTSPMHILTDEEWFKLFPKCKEALKLRNKLSKIAAGVELPMAPMVEYNNQHSADKLLKKLVKAGIKKRSLKMTRKYNDRLKTELKIIKQKKFADYFLVVSDLIEHCKTLMPVGPGRGSAAGSLICYLIGITEVDPLKYDLLFERFIDINRSDWPDIDFDISNQAEAIKYLQKKYGSENVAQMANINKLQPKSAIIRVVKALNIPSWEVEEFKESIEERPEGDSRARFAIQDAFESSKIGEYVLAQHPNFYHVASLEGHPSHVGIHAAGILVCPKPLREFCGINSRTKNHVAMIDKRDAEEINLLKIDALGLTTLRVLAEVCDQLGKPYEWIYTLPLDNKKTFKLINKQNLSGIFQMEGAALQELSRGMKIKDIEDLSALSALCRPGPLGSGAAYRYVQQKSGQKPVKYLSNHLSVVKWTRDTMGNIVYQEQLMGIVRELGGLSWQDVTKVRKLMGKSQGDEAFSQYKGKFISGAVKNGIKKKEATIVWEAMKNFGKYGFNKSHAIAYSILTYLTAYFKANHPLEFAVGILNNTNNNLTALKILRDLKEREGINHVCVDHKYSLEKWSVSKGFVIGGLTTVEGIGPAMAKTIIRCRKTRDQLPDGIQSRLKAGLNPFKYLYPGKAIYGKYYKKKSPFGQAIHIDKIKKKGRYTFIGMLTKRAIKDLNDQKQIANRGGKKVNGPSAYASMIMEDDTGSIDVSIGRFQFEELINTMTDNTQLNKSWFVIYGNLPNKKHRRIYAEDIRNITIDY